MKEEGHLDSYMQFSRSFKTDLKEGKELIKPIIENSLLAMFHLIESVLAKENLHVNKHQILARFLRTDKRIKILPEKEKVRLAELYGELEELRPPRVYGGKGNGYALKRVVKITEEIEDVCFRYVRI